MDKECLLDELSAALASSGSLEAPVGQREECPSSDFVIRMPCYAAFFAIAESSDKLRQTYTTAEEEIAGLNAAQRGEWPRDLELVLFVAGDKPPDPALVRGIVDDRSVCRKFVLWPDGHRVDEILADLPFWTLGDLVLGPATSITAGVREVVKGFDPNLIGDLTSHRPGAERILDKIREGKYNFNGESLTNTQIQSPRRAPSAFTRLEGLDITDFRGIRRLKPEDMPLSGDIVFIYGPNGVGKTSIAQSVEWAITGELKQLQRMSSRSERRGPDPIVNVFSENGKAKVSCLLRDSEPVCRFTHGQRTEQQIGSCTAVDDRVVIDHVVGTKAPSRPAQLRIERLRDLFRSSHMLSQHDLRDFLERTEAAERFDILTNMIGAEEFVRFREKVAAVLRRLRSCVGAMVEQSKSLDRELGDIAKKLLERQKDLEKLRHTVTSGKAPGDLVSELLQGMRSCQCDLGEDVIERADAESAEQRFELIAAHAESVIRSKKAATEDLMVRQEALQKELAAYVESQTRRKSLVDEIARAKDLSSNAGADLQKQEETRQDIEKDFQVSRTNQAECAKRHADLNWLKENLLTYFQGQEARRRMEDSLKSLRLEFQRAKADLEKQNKSLSAKRAQLQEIEQVIATKTSREQTLVALFKRLSHIEARRQEAEHLREREIQLNSGIGELKQQTISARDEVSATRARVDELKKAYNSEAARHDVLSSFLARIAEMVHSPECPLCGREFESAEEAMDGIRQHLSDLPRRLRDLVRSLNEAKENDDAKQTHANSLLERLNALETELEQVCSSKIVATKAMQDFLADCAVAGVTLSVEETASWKNIIEEAKKECEVSPLVSEAASLREVIGVFASRVVQQQNTVAGLQRELDSNEKENKRLISTVEALTSEMVKRGFEPDSLPQSDRLAAELTRVRGEARNYGELVARGESDLRAIESATTALRRSIKRANEDIASKETQIRQYEITSNRFVSECRAFGVDPKNPRDSIRVVKQRASKLIESLSILEEKRQRLEQFASLGRLRLEIDDLARTDDDMKRQAKRSSDEESRMRKWLSHVEGLEAEVVSGQVDVVGSHLKHLEPTTQRLYHRLTPHPVFGKVKIRINEKTRELDVQARATAAYDQLGEIAVMPSAFFSDAQMNSLAITVFLAGALRQRWSGFSTILIDDPVQQMDEMNVCAFLDLIRGLSDQRQFIIFTCSRDFYLLALDKLVCLNESKPGRFLAYRLEGIAPAKLKVHCDAEG